MMPARLRLKKSTGWFAAGQEVATALEILSDAGFKLYLYLCLNADRRTGRMAVPPAELARCLHWPAEAVAASLEELCRCGVCVQQGLGVAICDRFWPYERTAVREGDVVDENSYLERVRQMLLRPACVRASFSAADERLAVNWRHRGVTLIQIQRAIWLGCARKYVALSNQPSPMWITSLHYFAAIVDEVAEASVGDDYWNYIRGKVAQLERRWIEAASPKAPGGSKEENEMMETK
jgi:hypothetical protein